MKKLILIFPVIIFLIWGLTWGLITDTGWWRYDTKVGNIIELNNQGATMDYQAEFKVKFSNWGHRNWCDKYYERMAQAEFGGSDFPWIFWCITVAIRPIDRIALSFKHMPYEAIGCTVVQIDQDPNFAVEPCDKIVGYSKPADSKIRIENKVAYYADSIYEKH